MRKVTLGGDRLGSGNKQKIELHGYERSTHDLGYLWRSSMSAGTLVPFLHEIALPGDTFDINLGCDVKTHPTIGPLFGSYKVQLDVFTADIRLYQGQLHNNKLKIGLNMAAIKLPIMTLQATMTTDAAEDQEDIDNTDINPSCIHAYLGIRGIGLVDPEQLDRTRTFHALWLLMYWDTYKNYYANKQEELGAVIHTTPTALVNTVSLITVNGVDTPQAPSTINQTLNAGFEINIAYIGASPIPEQILFYTNLGILNLRQMAGTSLVDTGTNWVGFYDLPTNGIRELFNWNYIAAGQLPVNPPTVVTFDLNNLDVMRENILSATQQLTPYNIADANVTPYNWVIGTNITGTNKLSYTQEGLALKTYQSDLFNNWLRTEYIDGPGGINEITAVDVSGGTLVLDALNLAKKVYNMLNRIAVSGGSYYDWIIATYDHEPYAKAETPVYHGGLIKELVFQEVVSNASTTAEGGQPLGTLAGKGIMANKHKGGEISIKISEHGLVMGIVSITPRIDYSQGNKWDTHLQTMDDFHKPALDEIGFQELITEQMAWWSTRKTIGGAWVTTSAGKQPAWLNYMTNVNENHGNFAIISNEMFMTLNRRYEYAVSGGIPEIKDLTTYIDPVKFNYIFAQTSLDAQNFWVQIAVDMTVRRKMSAKIMPNL